MAHFSKVLDEVRAHEIKALKAKGLEPVLTKFRWIFLERPENLASSQGSKPSAKISSGNGVQFWYHGVSPVAASQSASATGSR